jgi:hypothetical protein
MYRPHRSDRSARGLVRLPDPPAAQHRRDPESGQATTEFALILVPLLIVVCGIIYFGIGLNYWLDMNRAANQGARFAAVNNWGPQCLRGDTCNSSTSATACSSVLGTTQPYNTKARLQDVIRCLPRNGPAVSVCYPGKAPTDATIGDPVKITLTAPYKFFIMKRLQITLTASATSRLEQIPQTSLVTGAGGPTC